MQALVLMRNLAIEADHLVLLVKSGVLTSVGNLIEAVIRRRRRKFKKNLSGLPTNLYSPEDGVVERRDGQRKDDGRLEVDAPRLEGGPDEEALLSEAMEFVENLCPYRGCRDVMMEDAEGKLIQSLFQVCKDVVFSLLTRRSVSLILTNDRIFRFKRLRKRDILDIGTCSYFCEVLGVYLATYLSIYLSSFRVGVGL